MYPLAKQGLPQAATYGKLQVDKYEIALIYHTTETLSWAGFKLGLTAPHYSYKAATREWRWHGAAITKRVGTMKSSRTTGVIANEKSIQVEIICYSNKRVADERDSRLWVGDFTEDNYRDLAHFAAWIADQSTVRLDVVMETPSGGWTYGADSPHRLPEAEWLAFNGIGAHGGVTAQRHWDTGVLDLGRIARYAQEHKETDMSFLPMEFGDGYPNGTELIRPDNGKIVIAKREHKRSDARGLQGMVLDAGTPINVDGKYGPKTVQALMDTIASAADSQGYVFHGNDLAPLLRAMIQAVSPPGRDGIDGSHGKDGADGADGADGIDGSHGKDGLGLSPGDLITSKVT